MIKQEYYVVEDLDMNMYWHIQKAEWMKNPFEASRSPCTPEEYEKLAKRIVSERFLKVQKRHMNSDRSCWKPGHKLGIAKVSFICEDGEEPHISENFSIFS